MVATVYGGDIPLTIKEAILVIYRLVYFEPDTSPHQMAVELTQLQDRYPMAQFHWYVHPKDKGVGVVATNSVAPPDEAVITGTWWHHSELWWRDELGNEEVQMQWARQWRVISAPKARMGA